MRKKHRKKVSMPHWFWLDDYCLICNHENSCGKCKFAKRYKKKFFASKEKGRHSGLK